MNPDDIRSITVARFPEIIAKRRSNPDGWSFFVSDKTGKKTRIFRAVQSSASSPTKLKRAVSSILQNSDDVIDFQGSQADLISLIEAELKLHFQQ